MPHLDSDQWKHFILNILLLVGGDATHSFTSILLLHAPHTLDHNCTCQNNPSLGFFFWHVWYLHVFSSISAHMVVWEAFLSSLHTIILCMCTHFIITISLIIIHYNFHPIVRCSFMHTKLSAPICKGVRFTEHQPSPVLSKIGFVTGYYIYVTLLVCTCH